MSNFYCLIKSDTCKRSWFGNTACDMCEKNGDWRGCGRHQASFCEKCVNRRFENDKASTTL